MKNFLKFQIFYHQKVESKDMKCNKINLIYSYELQFIKLIITVNMGKEKYHQSQEMRQKGLDSQNSRYQRELDNERDHMIHQIADIQDEQLLYQQLYPMTRNNGVTDPNHLFSKAIKANLDAEQDALSDNNDKTYSYQSDEGKEIKENGQDQWGQTRKKKTPVKASPVYKSVKMGQAGFSGPNIKGSLDRAFKEKQPWTYRKEMLKNFELKDPEGIKLMDSKHKVQQREQIIEETQQSITNYRYNSENFDIKLDANNKYADKFKNTADFAKKRKLEPSAQTTFRKYYELQNQKLEFQKKNLIKLQKLQKERQMMRTGDSLSASMQQKDIGRLRDQYVKLKKFNDAALDDFKFREQLVKAPRYDKLEPISMNNDPFERDKQLSSKPVKISIEQPQKTVTYKTGFQFFSHKNSIRKDEDKFDRSNIDPEIIKSLTAESTHSFRHRTLAPLSGSVTLNQNVFNTTWQTQGAEAMMTMMTPESHVNSPAIKRETNLDNRFNTVSQSGQSSPIHPQRAHAFVKTEVKRPQRYKEIQLKEIAHQKKKNADITPQNKLGHPPLLPMVSQDVRISSNKEDTNLDNIMEMVMRSKIEHKNFDPLLGRKSTRDYIKGLVFEHSELAPYKPYVYNKKISDFIDAGLKSKKTKRDFQIHHEQDHASKSHGVGSTTNSTYDLPNTNQDQREHDLLPTHLGANAKDFQRSKWLADNLSKKPYFEQQADQHKKNKDYTLDDPVVVKEREWQRKLGAENEKFQEMVSNTFDPLGLKKENGLSPEKKMEIYDMQVKHYDKLFQKSSNNNINGLPDYLDKFVAQDNQRVSHLVKKVLQGKYNYRKDKELLKEMEVAFEKYKRVGGPLKKQVLEEYPGDDEFIRHLEKEYGYEHRTGMRPWQILKLKQLGTSQKNLVNTHPMLLNSKKTLEALSLRKEQSSLLRSNTLKDSAKEQSSQKGMLVGLLNRQSTLSPHQTSTKSVKKIASDSNNSPPMKLQLSADSSKLMPKLKINSPVMSVEGESDQMNKSLEKFPRENRSGGELSNGNQYSDLGAEDRYANDRATMDAHQPFGSKQFLKNHNMMSSQGAKPGLQIDTEILSGALPRQKGCNPFNTSRVVKMTRSDVMTDQNTIDQTKIGAKNSEPSLHDTAESPFKGESNAKGLLDTTQKTNSTLPEGQSMNKSIGVKIIGDSGVMTDAINVSQSFKEDDKNNLNQNSIIADETALNISAGQDSDQLNTSIQEKEWEQRDKVFLTQNSPLASKRSPKQQNKNLFQQKKFQNYKNKTLEKVTKTQSILHQPNAAVSKIRLEVDSRVVSLMKTSKSRSKSKSQEKSTEKKKKRKRSATLNERVKKIKKYVNAQLSERQEPEKGPPLQKYTRQRRGPTDIYENSQISEIMHPGSEEWVRLVTERLFQLNRKLVQRLGSTELKSSSNKSKIEGSRRSLEARGKIQLSGNNLNQTMAPKTVINSEEQSLLVQALNSSLLSPKNNMTATLGKKTPRHIDSKKHSQVSFSRSRAQDGMSEQHSILSSGYQNGGTTGNKTPQSKLSIKTIGGSIQKFVDELEFEIKNTQAVSEYSEFDRIHNVRKQEKQVKHAIIKYLEMITSNPNETDLENTILDFMEDRKVTKILFRENLLSEDNLGRMKDEIFQNSLKIASYGRRQNIWMPNKFQTELAPGKRKAPTVKFDKDGNAYYPDE